MGHLAKECKVARSNAVRKIDPELFEKNFQVVHCNVAEALMVKQSLVVEDDGHRILCVKGSIGGNDLKLSIDSGTSHSILAHRVALKNNFEILPSNVLVKSQNNAIEPVVGITKPMDVQIGDSVFKLEFLITNNSDHEVLLGIDWFNLTKAWFCPVKKILWIPGPDVPPLFEVKND